MLRAVCPLRAVPAARCLSWSSWGCPEQGSGGQPELVHCCVAPCSGSA